jgi:hypothetical protein
LQDVQKSRNAFCNCAADDFKEEVFGLTLKLWTIIGHDYVLNWLLGNLGVESAFNSISQQFIAET